MTGLYLGQTTTTRFRGRVRVLDKFSKKPVNGIWVRAVDKEGKLLDYGLSDSQGVSFDFDLPVGTEPYYRLAFPNRIESRIFLDGKDLDQVQPAVSGGENTFEITVRRLSATPIWTAAAIFFAGILGLYYWTKDR